MKKQHKQGFTLVELMVVLVIFAIIVSIAVPGLSGYIHYAQFRRNNSYAKTLYYAAEASLTDMRTSGEWKDLEKEIRAYGIRNTALGEANEIIAIRLNSEERVEEGNLVRRILENSTYDGDLLNGVIALEIDVATGRVYGAFYGTNCTGLSYEENPGTGVLNMNLRDYDLRRPDRLGYYGAGEVTADVGLEVSRLRITSIHLLNGESLTLNWSSNSRHHNQDVSFVIRLYNADGGAELYSMELNCTETNFRTGSVTLDVTQEQGVRTTASYCFPLTYNDANDRFTLTLDAMMTAELIQKLDSPAQIRNLSTSITRFDLMDAPMNIYATIQAFPTYPAGITSTDTREYQKSTPTKSNSANTLFADSSSGTDYKITAFRHLSNIRYVAGAGTFTVAKQMMNWQLADAPLYNGTIQPLRSDTAAFPSVPLLEENQIFQGNSNNTTLRLVKLDETSISDSAEFLGLFGENRGSIRNMKMDQLSISYNGKSVRGVGGFCGLSSDGATLQNLSVTGKNSLVDVYFPDNTQAQVPFGTGAVAGIALGGKLEYLEAEGLVQGRLPSKVFNGTKNHGGVGGILGYAKLDGAAQLLECSNRADVRANLCAGGVVGYCWADDLEYATAEEAPKADLYKCTNRGLILYEDEKPSVADVGLEGHYIGGIAGFSQKIYFSDCVGGSGRASNYTFDPGNREALLRGIYVGGILGKGQECLLYNCSTEAGSYVLGSDYVGGIVGGLDGVDDSGYEKMLQSASVTRNSSYVIGNRYVGGICGQNVGNSTIYDCVNNGVAVGYDQFVGGICGANGVTEDVNISGTPEIRNCTSYIADINGEIYDMILGWGATGDYSGGLVGYNSGKIIFEGGNKVNDDVAGIVVGVNYVGGVVGFNDVGAEIDAEYGLISGRIYATGDCVGGLVGLNASTQLLEPKKELVIMPNLVRGRDFVGGAIGANLIQLKDGDLEVSNIRVNSRLGSITGETFCGGLMGYTATYDTLGSSNMLRAGAENFLPKLDPATNVPELKANQTTEYALIITSSTEKGIVNNMTIRAYGYFGGILGYAHRDDKVILTKCTNEGDLLLSQEAPLPRDASGTVSSLSGEQSGVDVESFLAGYTDLEDISGLKARLAGGIISVNGKHQVIDACKNTGFINGISVMGGVVGLNQGCVINCGADSSMGAAEYDFIGGIVGLNVGSGETASYQGQTYNQGAVINCTTSASRSIGGRNYVGGIIGYNGKATEVSGCINRANVSGLEAVGGLCGKNAGDLVLEETDTTQKYIISATTGDAGGIAGINTGAISIPAGKDVTVVNDKLTVRGGKYIGGILGTNAGILEGSANGYLVCGAELVQAITGYAGGIVGIQTGSAELRYVNNQSGKVSADAGVAGGIVSINNAGFQLVGCIHGGDVTSNRGFAGGITSRNYGTIKNCTLERGTISSVGETYAGAVCGANYGTISGITMNTAGSLKLSGSASCLGGVTGLNAHIVENVTIKGQMSYEMTAEELTVGGAVGENGALGEVKDVTVTDGNFSFSNYCYLGGIVAWNKNTVANCTFSGTIQENGGKVGYCYGGIVGLNDDNASVTGCGISGLTIQAEGEYTATDTNTAEQKEQLSTHVGGIVGKNSTGATISDCTIDSSYDAGKNSAILVGSGMVGGIAGFNKGIIQYSGDKETVEKIRNAASVEDLLKDKSGFEPEDGYLEWNSNKNVEELNYDEAGDPLIAKDRSMQIIVSGDGNLGGIAGYNGPDGKVDRCGSGKWLLNNKASLMGVGTGGIIGMNESRHSLTYLVNRAFVGRQLSNKSTDRFAGGIIGNQTNITNSDWTISQCVNYGMVYCFNAHYSGGIIGQWKSNGGTLLECYNYASLQTTYKANWVGASGGIVAQIYHPTNDHEFNIISCQNHGSIYGQQGRSVSQAANDSAGILGNVTAYYLSTEGPRVYINLVDCVNGPGVEIYSGSIASGIFGFLSIDSNHNAGNLKLPTQNYVININQCRNYAKNLDGDGYESGIFGDRYDDTGKNTYITNCFSAYFGQNFPIISLNNRNSTTLSENMVGNNYYFSDGNETVSGYASTTKKQNELTEAVSEEWNATEYALAGTRMLSLMRKDTNGGYFFAQKGEDSPYQGRSHGGQDKNVTRYTNYTQNSTRIDGSVLRSNGTNNGDNFSGRVIFELPSGYVPGNYTLDKIKTAGSNFDEYVRTAYQSLEKITAGAIAAPKKDNIKVVQSNGSYTVTVTDDQRPVYYEVEFTVDGVTTVCYLFPKGMSTAKDASSGRDSYTSTGTFFLGKNNAAIRIRAVSMFEDPSGWVTASNVTTLTSLAAPEVQGYLVKNTAGAYVYEFRLTNPEAYAAVPGWQVKAYTLETGEDGGITFTETNLTGTLEGKESVQDLTLEAIAPADSGFSNSNLVHIPVSIPINGKHITYVSTGGNEEKDTVGMLSGFDVEITGNTLETLEITGKLSWKNVRMDTPPIYRVELLGTVPVNNVETEVVLASTEVLGSAGKTVNATLRDLPEIITTAKNLRVRAWYADTGLGGVRTYQWVDAPVPETSGGVILRSETVENGVVQESFSYLESTVLANTGTQDFAEYVASKNIQPIFLDPPVLMDPGDGVYLPQDWSDDRQELRYTFTWDQDLGTATTRYTVKLLGMEQRLNEQTNQMEWVEVQIPVSGDYRDNTKRTLTVNADDWQYAKVRLTVTRLGSGTNEVGQSSTKDYLVGRRLDAPGQPVVVNRDPNELEYTISWDYGMAQNASGYILYVHTSGETREIPIKGGLTTSTTVDLNDYAGESVDIYLRALAKTDAPEDASLPEGFADSANGIAYTMTVPERLPEPVNLDWAVKWSYDRNAPVSVEAFTSGGLRVEVDTSGGRYDLPGGSAFLIQAVVLDMDKTTELYSTSMTAMSTQDDKIHYQQLLDIPVSYAGHYLYFNIRATYGNGMVSSNPVQSGIFRLPYVQLDPTNAVSQETVEKMTVYLTPVPNLSDKSNSREWDATLRTLTWNSVEGADLYPVTITYADGTTLDLRIYQMPDGMMVERKVPGEDRWELVQPEDGKLILHTTEEQTDYYTSNMTLPYFSYTMDTVLSWEETGDGGYKFTLRLPNISTILTDADELIEVGNILANSVKLQACRQENMDGGMSESFVDSIEQIPSYAP